MSGYFESVGWNACEHRLDLGLYFRSKELGGGGGAGGGGGMESEPMLIAREKKPSAGKKSLQRSIEHTTLHQTGQRVQHTSNELSRPPEMDMIEVVAWVPAE